MNNLSQRRTAFMLAAILLTPQVAVAAAMPTTPRMSSRAAAIGGPRVIAAAAHGRPQPIVVPDPPRRTPRPLPPAASFHPVISTDVHPASGKRLSGPPMQLPHDIGQMVTAARAQAKQRSVRSLQVVPPGAYRVISPGRAHGAGSASRSQIRTTQSLLGPAGAGINHWWRYQEEKIPGGGHVMINVGTGNVLIQDDDMAIPHKGMSLTFQRTYNSQSLHTVAGGGAEDNGNNTTGAGMYGNGWTNTFDAHMVKLSDTIRSVYDIDGTRYDYVMPVNPSWTNSMILHPATSGNFDYVQYDGQCGWYWIKKDGTIYYFYLTDPGINCPALGMLGAYSGRLYRIYGRNYNNYLTLSYSWDGGDASMATGKIFKITVQTESGMTATLNFTDVAGHRLLGGLWFPDTTTYVAYGYDTQGNLNNVSRPPNNATGERVFHSYGYVQQGGGGSIIGWADSPLWAKGGGYGDVTSFAFTGNSPQTATLNAMSRFANVNPLIYDGSNSSVLQAGYPTSAYEYYDVFYTTGGPTATFRDTDGHGTNWVIDPQGRPTQTQECVVVVNQACNQNSLLITNESWDTSNNLISEVDPRNNETDYAYDVDGNTVAVAAPPPTPGASRPTSLYLYGPYDNLVAYCDPIATHALQAEWTSRPTPPIPVGAGSCPAQSTLATRYQWTYPWYEPFGELTASISPGTPAALSGYQRTYAYDPASQGGVDYGLPSAVTGAPITQNDAATPVRQPQQFFWYDANGNLSCYGTGNGGWLLSYDALGHVTSVADPDDSASGTGVCGRTGAQPNWNTTTRMAYFPDGSVASKQTPSQVASGLSTTFTYDVDGNERTETHHFGCLGVSTCTPGVTQKFYDGVDRLVEVQAPYDANDVQAYPWSTRYIYDLSGGQTTRYRGIPLTAHGNLVTTQELLTATVWTPTFLQRYAMSTGSWTDARATSYDALDRPVSTYEAAFGDQPKISNTYDGPGTAGLLSSTLLATGERKTLVYDDDGRTTDVQYPNDPSGTVTAATHSVFDVAGRITSRSTSVLGAETIAYDATGAVTSVTEPASLGGGTIIYSYFADGLRSGAGYSDANGAFPNALQYSYRADGKRDRVSLANGTAFTWTYSAAGRMLSQSDPLTGTTVSPTATYDTTRTSKPFYPSTITYAPSRSTYDSSGRLSALTLPVSLFAYTGLQYDLEDGIAQLTNSGYSPTTVGYTSSALTCLESSVRNEKTPLSKGYLTSSPCTMSPNPPGEINGAQVAPGDGSSAGAVSARIGASGNGQNWTLDARSGMLLHINKPLGSDTVGATYTYDASGRLTQDVEAVSALEGGTAATPSPAAHQMSGWCPVIYVGTPAYPNGFTCYENGSRTKTYDAEDRLRTETLDYIPEYSANGPTYSGTSYGFAMYGAYWEDSTGYGQPANLQAVDYGATSHPMRFALYHPDRAGNPNMVASESRVWLWDGNDRFLECGMANNTCQKPSLSVEGLADYDLVHGTLTRVNDRNQAGQVVMSRDATSFSAWSDVRSWTNGKTFFSPCSFDYPNGNPAPTVCDPQHDGKLTPDGWSLDMETWQGVRTFDPAVGQWNSPDAYVGEVHDPISQKPFMWNHNNAYAYSDPSGFRWNTTLRNSPQQRMIDYMRSKSPTFDVIYNTLARSKRTYTVGFSRESDGVEYGGFFLAAGSSGGFSLSSGSIMLHPFGKFDNGADSELAGMIDRFAHEIGHAFDYETSGGHLRTDLPAPPEDNPHNATNYAEWYASKIHDTIMEEMEKNGYDALQFAGQHAFGDLPPYGVFPK